MGFFDVLFGEAPSTEVNTLPTLTPEQQQSLNQLLRELGGGSPTFDGDVSIDHSDLSQLSLDALEERARVLGNPDRQNLIATSAADTLMKLLDFSSEDAGIEDFFKTNVRDPALQEFQDNVLPQISRSFGGANFFSSERTKTDQNAQGDLIESLTRSRSELAFNSRESNRNRALQALGLAGNVDALSRGDSQELMALFGIGQEDTALSERNIGREFERFMGNEDVAARRRDQTLGAVNTTAIENVVTQNQGTGGLAGPLIAAAGTAFGGPLGGALASKMQKKKPTGSRAETGHTRSTRI